MHSEHLSAANLSEYGTVKQELDRPCLISAIN